MAKVVANNTMNDAVHGGWQGAYARATSGSLAAQSAAILALYLGYRMATVVCDRDPRRVVPRYGPVGVPRFRFRDARPSKT